jgi:hypothetical protein
VHSMSSREDEEDPERAIRGGREQGEAEDVM